jgi:hypothetical protein
VQPSWRRVGTSDHLSPRLNPRFSNPPTVTPSLNQHNRYPSKTALLTGVTTAMGFLDTIATKVALQRAGLGGVSLPKDNPFAGNSKGTQEGAANGGMANPFANMQWPPKAFSSWQAPPVQAPVRDAPIIGEKAQSSPKLQFPTVDARPVVILFLRYCGCPCKHHYLPRCKLRLTAL